MTSSLTPSLAAVAEIRLAVAEGVAEVSVSNARQRNALTRRMCRELIAVFTDLGLRDDVHLVVLRGAHHTFCSGVAITELRDVLLDTTEGPDPHDHLSEVDAAIRACPVPVIAAVEGFCFGGGWQLASACDFVIAADNAAFAITPSKLGIIYPRVGVERLVRLVGPMRAKYLLDTGLPFDAARALQYGLVAEVFPAETFGEHLHRFLEVLLSRSQFSVTASLELIDSSTLSETERDALWAERWREMISGEDLETGIEAFTHHRSPQFTWR